jgi:hypothetical protein
MIATFSIGFSLVEKLFMLVKFWGYRPGEQQPQIKAGEFSTA